MITLKNEERTLLMQVLEYRPEVGRRGNPRLRPLSMYSSELKNFKQVADIIKRIADGQVPSEQARTAQRYSNTLSNMGLWMDANRGTDISAAGQELLKLAETDDSQADFWQRQTRAADKIFFAHQLRRLVGSDSERALVSAMWRSVFFNVQDVLDHFDEADIRVALEQPDLKEIEALQYMDSVGTEPWRYSRLDMDKRQEVQTLLLRLRSDYDANQNPGDDIVLAAAVQYGKAIDTVQRDVRFRVAGFIEAFLDVRADMTEGFPRLAPNGEIKLPPSLVQESGTSRSVSDVLHAPRRSLPLPLQVIISGCPGSGKSALAERSALGAVIIRTQFHAETTTATFVGGYRPTPVYETASDIVELSGAPFSPGRPLIDYRFVPGPALLAVAAAIAEPERNVVLLIEELNRGNAAAIFGELFQLLDRRDDGWSRYGVAVGAEAENWLRLNNALGPDATLRFPPNLHLWATMNSGDQGVFPVDTAFRRRWAYRYLGYAEPCAYAKADQIVRFAGRNLDWDRFRQALNKRLKALQVVEDRLIGPYFLTVEQLHDPAEVLSKLLLYLWDDVLRFRQQELFRADSFAGVTADWNGGEGNPLLNAVLDFDEAVWIGDTGKLLSDERRSVAAPNGAVGSTDDDGTVIPHHRTDGPKGQNEISEDSA